MQLLRRQVNARQSMDKAAVRVYGGAEQGPAGGMILTGEIFDDLVQLYEHTGFLGGYELREGLPVITMTVERRRGGVQVEGSPALASVQGLDYDYLFSEDTLWRLQRPGCTRILPALQALGGKSLFFTSADATAFCSYVLPELGSKLNIVDPERLLLNQIPLEPVVQFYLDAPDSFRIEAHAEFLYGEDKVTPFVPSPAGLCGMCAPRAGQSGCWPLICSPVWAAERKCTAPLTRTRSTACWRRACRPCWPRVKYT